MLKLLVPVLKRLAWHVRVIPDREHPEQPYISRHYLIGGPNHRNLVVCLHRIHCGDPADLHDHPAAYVSLILAGGYLEETPEGTFRRKPGHIRFRSGRSLHRLTLDPNAGEVWTLFIMFKRTRNWGFRTRGGWVPHEKYLGEV